MSQDNRLVLSTLLAEYPCTRALRRGALTSDKVAFDYANVKKSSGAFKRVVRNGEFDVSEMAIVTYLIARAYHKPMVLLPAVVVGRFQHGFILYNAERGHLAPSDLSGRRVAIRSYSVTTSMWVRGILQNDYGVDLDSITWVTSEDPHVQEFSDPSNVERAPEGEDPASLLLAGKVDAAIMGEGGEPDPRLAPLIPDPAGAAREWAARNQALQINHMMIVRPQLVQSRPDAVREVYRLLKASNESPENDGLRMPFGIEANRRNLEVAIDYVYKQRLIPRRFTVDELFDDVAHLLD